MAKTIPKLNINAEALHEVRRKLQMLSKDDTPAIPVTWQQRDALLQLINAGKKTLYPGQMEVDRYQYHLDQLEKVDPTTDPHQFEHFAERIQEFEEKYCK